MCIDKGKKIISIGVAICVLIVLILMIVVSVQKKPVKLQEHVRQLAWKTSEGESVGPLPLRFDGRKTVELDGKMPSIFDGESLMIVVDYSELEVTIGGKVVYQEGLAQIGPVKTAVGRKIAFVPLSEWDSGKSVHLRLVTRSDTKAVSLTQLGLVVRNDHIMHVAVKNAMAIVIALIFLIMGMMALVLWFYMKPRKDNEVDTKHHIYIYAAVLMLSAGIWTVTDTHILGMLFDNMTASGLLNYVAFNLMPVGCLGLVEYFFHKKIRAVDILFKISELNFIVQMLFFFGGVFDLPDMVIVTQLMSVMAVTAFMVVAITSIRKDKSKNNVQGALWSILVALLLIYTLFAYRLEGSWKVSFLLALIILISGIIAQMFYVLYSTIRAGFVLEEMKKHAYTDGLTGLLNRRAYSEEAERIESLKDYGNLAVLSMDLNGLKTANDMHGHDAGDELLVAAANCIRTVYEEQGKCFRMGGDEFLVLAFMTQEKLEDSLRRFYKKMDEWSGNAVKNLSISVGVVTHAQYPNKNLAELLKSADMEMYADKASYYESTGKERRRERRHR